MKITLRKGPLHWLHLISIYVLAIGAAAQLYLAGGFLLILVPLGWGMGLGGGMESGVRNASQAARERKSTRITSWFGYSLLFALLFLPAFAAIHLGEWLSALSIAFLTLSVISFTSQVLKRVFGPWHQDPPRTSDEA